MKVKHLNSSSIKTRDAIKKAFAEVLQEKRELRLVTVQEIVKKAEITRSSFYNHYDNIYDVAREFQDEMLNVLINNDIKITSLDDVYSYIDEITKFLREHEEIYSMILASDDTFLFMDKLNKLINEKLLGLLKYYNINDKELKVTFFTDGTINLVTRYFKKELPYNLEDISTFIKKEIKNFFL